MRISLVFALLISLASTAIAQNWIPTNLPYAPRYDEIYFHSPDTGWAVNTRGEIYRTNDGGDSWILQHQYANAYLRSVEFLDENIGMVGSLDSLLLRTTDGGQTWTPLFLQTPGPLPGICGWSHYGNNFYGVGYFGYPAYFIKSTDQGVTWSYTDLSAYADGLIDCHFIDENIGFVGGISQDSGAVVLKTIDGGDNWSVMLYTQNGVEYLWKFDFVTPQLIYGSIEAFSGPTNIVKSVDGGTTWTTLQVSPQQLDIQGIGFIDANKGWVGPRNSPMFETTDGGQTWTELLEFPNINKFFRINSQSMYASGYDVYKFNGTTSVVVGPSIEPQDHLLSNATPNPFQDHAQWVATINNLTFARMDLLDAQGRHIKNLHAGYLPPGEHLFQLDAATAAALPAGNYFMVLRTSEGATTRQCIKAGAAPMPGG
ncbi:MAG: YCF48-related protein [Salibacteraceae bacterium]